MKLTSLLAEFGSETGLGECPMDEEGVCRLVFDGDLVVDVEQEDIEEGQAGFVLYSAVGLLPADDPKVLRRLLGANLFARGTNDAVLALDEQLDEVVLFRRCEPEQMDYAAFVSVLTDFVNQLEYWREDLARGCAEEEGVPLSEDERTPLFAAPSEGIIRP